MIPSDDRGLLLGDGLFETVLARDGELVLWDAHVARLQAGCRLIGLPEPDALALRAAALNALGDSGLIEARAAVRLTWTAGSGGRGVDRPDPLIPRLIARAAPAPKADGPISLAIASTRRNERSPASRLKTLAYLDNVLARREARAAGAEEAVMLNTIGRVACAAVANIFWISNGWLHTPRLDCGVLDGVMRAQVLRAAAAMGIRTEQISATRGALRGAEGVFISNSLVGLREASSLDGRVLSPHPLAAALAARLGAVS